MPSSLQAILALFFLCCSTLVSCATTSKVTTGLIVPLYRYPEDSTSWAPLFTAIKSNPTVPFTVIINPNSGPGAVKSQPDANYQLYTAQLKSYKNVQLAGYVRTGYGERSASDVLNEVATYKLWKSSYRPNGIFFDEVADGKLALYKNYTTYTYKQFANYAPVILNPGTTISSSYFGIASQIVIYESTYADYNYASLPSNNANKQSVIIYSLPNDTATLQAVLSPLVNRKRVASVYMTDRTFDENPYDGFGDLLNATAAYLGKGR